jgi:HK97 family phage major capsid protein
MDIREHVIKLNERRINIATQQQAHFDDCVARHPSEPMNVEERAKWDAMETDIQAIEAEVRTFVDKETRESESATAREAFERQFGTGALADAKKTEREQLADWFRGKSRRSDDPEEGGKNTFSLRMDEAVRITEAIRAGADANEVRALAWDTGSIASGVPTTTATELYQKVTASVALMRMPTYKFNTNSGEQMKFPRVNAHGIATQVSGQGTTLAGTDATFLSMTLDAFKYAELYKVANEVLQDTAFDVVGFLTGNVARAVGEVMGTDLAVGTGSGQPNGVMTALVGAGTIATGGSLITPTYENLVDLVYSVNGNYRARPSTAFLMRDLTAAVVRKLRDGAGGTLGAPLWSPSQVNGIQGAEPDRLLGYPVWTDPNIASCASNAKVMAFGDFSAYYVRTAGDFMFERDDSRYFDTDEVGFRGKWRVDGDLIDTTAINALKQSV